MDKGEKNYEFSQEKKRRLEEILSICRNNCQQNEDWIRVLNLIKVFYFYNVFNFLLSHCHLS